MKSIICSIIVAAAVCFAAEARAQSCNTPRFLCNGVNAGEGIQPDFCGSAASCNADTAARWEPAIVAYRYDRTTVPGANGGVSQSQWGAIITNARESWVDAAGGGLSLSDGGNLSTRNFGNIDGENDIYWITSSSEWSNEVGGSAFSGVLGVTVTPYDCITTTERGPIIETDTVMNGVGGAVDWFNTDAQGVLAHEMGHGLGLDHPDEFCSNALMSALDSGVGFPQAVDIQGLLALYDIPPGAIGSPCSVNGDCDDNLCATVDGTSFCSQVCAGTCPNGMECKPVNGQDLCVFAGLGTAGIGDQCEFQDDCLDACTTGLDPGCNVCVGECARVCIVSTGEGCTADEFCFDFQEPSFPDRGACFAGEIVDLGEVCDGDSFCNPNANLACIGNGTSGTCFALCDNRNGSGCSGATQCFDLQGAGTDGACFPAGVGETGDACSDIEDCAVGFTCSGAGTCQVRCDMSFGECAAGEQCVGNFGLGSFCSGGAEGEGEGEGEGEEPPPPGGCRIKRGNFDCPNGEGCVIANDGDTIGVCERGANGDARTFEQCEEDDDCDSGLCEKGVCTRPCDIDDCPDGWDCDEERAPAFEPGGDAGICVPESCKDDQSICSDQGFFCTFTSTDNYVCAKDGDPVGCNCGSTTDSQATAVLLLGVLAILRRRTNVARGLPPRSA